MSENEKLLERFPQLYELVESILNDTITHYQGCHFAV